MIIRVETHEPCPCGSNSSAGQCCAPSGVLAPTAATLKSGRACGSAVAGCYARSLRDCGGGISGEHTVSENILDEISSTKVFVRGPRWPTGRWFTATALQSKVLCVRHNEMLSPLDARMGRFVKALRRFTDAADQGTWTFAIHGHDVERWLLKTICGLAASGQAATASGVPFSRDLVERWTRILYGHEPMPPSWGLYVRAGVGDSIQDTSAVSVAPISIDGALVGIAADLFGWSLTLALTHVDRHASRGAIGPESIYRLGLLQTERASSGKRVYLHWEPGDRDARLQYGARAIVPAK